jgi:ribonuclease BN (tRNA processing enzyme)
VLLAGCGAASPVALKAQGLDPGAVDAVVVTHLHRDHFGGLPFLILDGQFSGRSAPLQVAGPPGIRARLAEAMEALSGLEPAAAAAPGADHPDCGPAGNPPGWARRLSTRSCRWSQRSLCPPAQSRPCHDFRRGAQG